MVQEDRLSKVMIIFLAVTLVSSSFTASAFSQVPPSAPGDFIDAFVPAGSGGLDIPKNLEFGPDGNLYVLSFQTDEIIRYNGTTGEFIDIFVTSGSGGLDGPQGLVFGHDGNLYVSSEYTDEILRYDNSTGAFIDVYVTASSGGLNNPQELVFDSLGNLYVTSYFTHEVLRYAPLTGLFIGSFVLSGSGGLDTPQGLDFGPDGNLYVVSENAPKVKRYNSATGIFIDDFAVTGGGSSPKDLVFGPDGNLFVTINTSDKVKFFNGTTGANIGTYVTSSSGGLDSPQGLVFGSDDRLYVTSQNTNEILRYAGPFEITLFCQGVPATIQGTIGNDTLVGTSGNDVIVGLDGDDFIDSLGGDDIICGDLGDDEIYGGSGNDTIDAGDGDNIVRGESGDDTIVSGSGDDEIYGGDGYDTITAGDGQNYIEGNQKDDTIISGTGDDDIYGGDGYDTITAGDGQNYIEGNQRDDVISTGSGDDDIYGGAGDDLISAGDGNNHIHGEGGHDVINTGSGDDDVEGNNGDDCINTGSGSDLVDGGSGNNLINTGSCNFPPIVSIIDPVNGTTYTNDNVPFLGSAIDSENGDVSNTLRWYSDIDGNLGIFTGPVTNSSLSIGTHNITAIAYGSGPTDIGSKSHIINVDGVIPDLAPNVDILTPNDNDSFVEGDSITFSGTATDPEDGGISNLIHWTSDDDGLIGVGDSITNSSLSVGSHVITASVTDSFGNTDSHSHPITVEAPVDNPPTFSSIQEPVDGYTYTNGTIPFEGWAWDTEDGIMSNSISWTSDVDGLIGTGSELSVTTLSLGIHTITESITDSFGNTVTNSQTITVAAAPVDNPPTVNITTPSDGDIFVNGTLITLSGIATDSEDGDISANMTWTSDLYGIIGNGSSISSSIAPVGTHTITASVIDSFGNHADFSITMTITPVVVDASPDVSIVSPSEGSVYINGTSVTFSGTAMDSEDGDISASLTWDSTIEGVVGTGSSFTYSNLTIGTHAIEAKVTDSYGNTMTDVITMIITEESTELIMVCHFPPGNSLNPQQLMIPIPAVQSHLDHGDTKGKCVDNDEEIKKQATIALIKKQSKDMRDKNELNEKRQALKEIKKELVDFKKELKGIEKQKIKDITEEIKKVIKNLNKNPEYDREFKQILKAELKETKLEIKREMNTQEKIHKNKIDSKVHSLSKSNNPDRDAKKLGFDFKDGKTKVVIKLSDDNPEIVNQLSSIGKVNLKNDKHVQLTVKVSDLPKLNSINGIDKIRSPFSAVQFYEELSEGVYFINADLAHFAGITGQGIKAAVLDLAFTDNEKISDNVVQVKSFRQGIGYLPIQGTGSEASHGTAVAEIIADVAPDVELYLYSMETDIEFIAAVDEAISQQVDVIAMSAGWPNFPTDGTSHITQKIEEAVDNGIVFVVPSGNFANKHWEGNFADSNFNNWHEYSNSDEGLTITVTEERIIEEKPIVSYLMWDVGMGDVADFEMVLVDPLGQIVDYSANEQKTKSDTAFEYIHHIPDTEGTYSIGILYAGDMLDVSKRPAASLEIFSVNDELEHPISQSSVSVPADANGAIVVGAINHLDGTLEPFSSQGPTNNGRLAPHVVGPDGVTTLALGDKPFYGTSATAPYVAGIAALILQSNPDMTPEQVLNVIQENADSSIISLGDEYDYTSGYGSASAFFLIEDSEVTG